jgi:hypothetical protein
MDFRNLWKDMFSSEGRPRPSLASQTCPFIKPSGQRLLEELFGSGFHCSHEKISKITKTALLAMIILHDLAQGLHKVRIVAVPA